jgi:L-2-hydroxyglutarate oxidase LhgO
MAEKLECLVVGGGVIGIAIARRLAKAGLEVLVLEAESDVAAHTSSRNSEVIHAGIYYPTKSLKAKLCVTGRKLLYEYCEHKNVQFKQIGKIIIATNSAQVQKLSEYEQQANLNGVSDLIRLSTDEVAKLEPAVECVGGLLSPSTGIFDSHSFILALQADLEDAKGNVIFHSLMQKVQLKPGKFLVEVGESDSYTVECKYLVNAAGLWAPDVAKTMTGLPSDYIPIQHLAKGHYFAYQGKSPFEKLVYPVAGDGGLGIHSILDLAGQTRFGADVSWVNEIDYDFDASRKDEFVTAIRRYYPGLDSDKLVPAYTGIRPKLSGPGEKAADFEIQAADQHGVEGLINLFGIESPGLTASLAIAEYVHEKLLLSH